MARRVSQSSLSHPLIGFILCITPPALEDLWSQLTEVAFDYRSLTQSALAYALDQLPMVKDLSSLTSDHFLGGPNDLQRARLDHPLDSTIHRLTPFLTGSYAELAVGCPCPRLDSLTLDLTEANDVVKADVLALVEGRRSVRREGGPICWLKRVDIRFRKGSVDDLAHVLRGRGIDGWGMTIRGGYL